MWYLCYLLLSPTDKNPEHHLDGRCAAVIRLQFDMLRDGYLNLGLGFDACNGFDIDSIRLRDSGQQPVHNSEQD